MIEEVRREKNAKRDDSKYLLCVKAAEAVTRVRDILHDIPSNYRDDFVRSFFKESDKVVEDTLANFTKLGDELARIIETIPAIPPPLSPEKLDSDVVNFWKQARYTLIEASKTATHPEYYFIFEAICYNLGHLDLSKPNFDTLEMTLVKCKLRTGEMPVDQAELTLSMETNQFENRKFEYELLKKMEASCRDLLSKPIADFETLLGEFDKVRRETNAELGEYYLYEPKIGGFGFARDYSRIVPIDGDGVGKEQELLPEDIHKLYHSEYVSRLVKLQSFPKRISFVSACRKSGLSEYWKGNNAFKETIFISHERTAISSMLAKS